MTRYIVAEIGINHNGSIDTALEMVRVAKDCGCDAVKFQKRTIEAVYTAEELAKPRESVFGTTNGDLKRGLEFGKRAYDRIDAECRAQGIAWSASCWDAESVAFMAAYEPKWLKVPSALITDHQLLHTYRQTGIPVWMSTGMSTEAEWLAGARVSGAAVVLHCHSAYPSAVEEVNLSYLHRMKELGNWRVGYSGHTVSPWPTLCAAAMGAEVIEVHLTLSRTWWGTDQAASLEPKALAKLVEEIRTLEQAEGDGIKRVWPSEEPVRAKLRKR